MQWLQNPHERVKYTAHLASCSNYADSSSLTLSRSTSKRPAASTTFKIIIISIFTEKLPSELASSSMKRFTYSNNVGNETHQGKLCWWWTETLIINNNHFFCLRTRPATRSTSTSGNIFWAQFKVTSAVQLANKLALSRLFRQWRHRQDGFRLWSFECVVNRWGHTHDVQMTVRLWDLTAVWRCRSSDWWRNLCRIFLKKKMSFSVFLLFTLQSVSGG